MEPTLPTPESGSPERGPLLPSTPEQPLQAQPEREHSQERPAPQEQRSPHVDNSGAPMAPTPVTVPQPAPPAVQSNAPINDNPLIAADEDLIEKEWVDRAKLIIEKTKHDPYEQEKEINRLQADYLKKRYGKDIKMPSGE